jgi:hypothetical protein
MAPVWQHPEQQWRQQLYLLQQVMVAPPAACTALLMRPAVAAVCFTHIKLAAALVGQQQGCLYQRWVLCSELGHVSRVCYAGVQMFCAICCLYKQCGCMHCMSVASSGLNGLKFSQQASGLVLKCLKQELILASLKFIVIGHLLLMGCTVTIAGFWLKKQLKVTQRISPVQSCIVFMFGGYTVSMWWLSV